MNATFQASLALVVIALLSACLPEDQQVYVEACMRHCEIRDECDRTIELDCDAECKVPADDCLGEEADLAECEAKHTTCGDAGRPVTSSDCHRLENDLATCEDTSCSFLICNS